MTVELVGVNLVGVDLVVPICKKDCFTSHTCGKSHCSILKTTIPISMARLINQIVCVCAYLSNFHPALVPPTDQCDSAESDIEYYFKAHPDDSDYDGDCSSDEG